MARVDVRAPMAGTIREVRVSAGEPASEWQELLVMESMKMEIPIASPASGTVVEVLATVGVSVEEGAILARLET